jgi:diguanylate cyclase (GGDEF)-like protein
MSRRRDAPGARDEREVLPVAVGGYLTIGHPSWGVAFYALNGGFLGVYGLLLVTGRGGGRWGMLLTGAFMLVAVVAFYGLVLRRASAWRSWMTQAAMVTGEACIVFLTMSADGPVMGLAFASLYAWALVYAGLYLSPRIAGLHVAVVALLTPFSLAVTTGWVDALWASAAMLPAQVSIVVVTCRLAGALRGQTEEDALTGLVDRRGLDRKAARRSSRVVRGAVPWSVVVLDLDGLKLVNDRLGHEAGDEVLVAAARRWSACLRRGDVLARVGGDEFVLLLAGSAEEVAGVVDRLRAATPPEVGVSVGIAPWRVGDDFVDALRHADRAVHRAEAADGGVVATASGEPCGSAPGAGAARPRPAEEFPLPSA